NAVFLRSNCPCVLVLCVCSGMGCFWGAERLFWRLSGVFSTQVGYAGGFTPNPTYHEVCTGLTGHTEVVRVVFSPQDISLEKLLRCFWENHDPTQGMKQHNDMGTQYRSAIYTSSPTQQDLTLKTKVVFQQELDKKGYGPITTEILEGQQFYYAEDHHQQYLKKVPKGYCARKDELFMARRKRDHFMRQDFNWHLCRCFKYSSV
uniref:peptide-methionine (S)-S-oxide reductase n=1 Tax=Stegastes partitus TaxID=144197 RepID=A0A3B5AM83_9TELE